MPRITGPNLAEHVATQKANVLTAARRLFAERGVSGVGLADIAHEVGLGRTALYRYFPTKAHILQAWFDEEMDSLVQVSAAALASASDPGEALRAWLDVQLDFINDREHQVLSEATAAAGTLPPEVAAHFGKRHRELYATLDDLFTPATPEPALRRHRIMLVAGLIRSSAEGINRGLPVASARTELHRAAAAIALDTSLPNTP